MDARTHEGYMAMSEVITIVAVFFIGGAIAWRLANFFGFDRRPDDREKP